MTKHTASMIERMPSDLRIRDCGSSDIARPVCGNLDVGMGGTHTDGHAAASGHDGQGAGKCPAIPLQMLPYPGMRMEHITGPHSGSTAGRLSPGHTYSGFPFLSCGLPIMILMIPNPLPTLSTQHPAVQ